MSDKDKQNEIFQKMQNIILEHESKLKNNPAYGSYPDNYIDRCYQWALRDYWTVDEAANLLCGTDPERPNKISGNDLLENEISNLRSALLRANIPSKGKINKLYLVKDIIQFAEDKQIQIPNQLRLALTNHNPESSKSSIHGNKLANAAKREAILGAALYAVVNFPAQCKGPGEKITGASIAKILEEKQSDLFKDRVAPWTTRIMAEKINKYLSIRKNK